MGELEPVLVLGTSGMLGRSVTGLLQREGVRFATLRSPAIDLGSAESIERAVEERVATVINCAAYTDVDGAEADEAKATAVNGHGVGMLARRCRATGALLVHYSTDYVFSGAANRPYELDHKRAPSSAYGRSKVLGEQLLEQAGCEALLLRTSWLYAPWGKNFVLTMRGLMASRASVKVVDDQVGRPTSAEYLAERTLALLRRSASGTFHVTDGGECSWYGLASEIARVTGSGCRVEPCSTADFPRAARRPAYSVLDLHATEALLGPSRPWQENLARVLSSILQRQP